MWGYGSYFRVVEIEENSLLNMEVEFWDNLI